MEKDLNQILEDFSNKENLYNSLGISTVNLLQTLFSEISIHQITHRVKSKQSLSLKIVKKNYKYKNFQDITDILGIRIITYFEDDIDLIEAILNKEFKVDKENTIDKRNVDIDKFGYRSVHYILQLNSDRTRLSEYKTYKNLKFEIQVRSILQHSWAEIEHDLGYKGINEVPLSAKRTFYRAAALLEQVDIEFIKLRKEILAFENEVSKSIIPENNNIIKITKSSLIAYIKNSKIVKDLEIDIINKLNCQIDEKIDDFYFNDDFIYGLQQLEITTITDLDTTLQKYRSQIINSQIKFAKKIEENFGEVGFIKGAPVLWLHNFLSEDTEK